MRSCAIIDVCKCTVRAACERHHLRRYARFGHRHDAAGLDGGPWAVPPTHHRSASAEGGEGSRRARNKSTSQAHRILIVQEAGKHEEQCINYLWNFDRQLKCVYLRYTISAPLRKQGNRDDYAHSPPISRSSHKLNPSRLFLFSFFFNRSFDFLKFK